MAAHSAWFSPRAATLTLLLVASAGIAAPGAAQVLSVTPPCGKAGETVAAVFGSGWTEPPPPCEYRFFFDAQQVATQPDGISGPPNSSFTVPAGATPGQHIVKVELRIIETGELKQCATTPFKVVTSYEDPWTVTVVPGGQGIDISFDPKKDCDTQCDRVYLVQVVRTTGTGPNQPTPTPIVPSSTGMDSRLDADQGADGRSVDVFAGSGKPYYNGDNTGGTGVNNANDPVNRFPSDMYDGPTLPDNTPNGKFPPGIDQVTMEFEVNAFCAAGPAAGQWLGRTTWTWTRTKGAAGGPWGTCTKGASSRTAPSPEFTTALDNWKANHNFTLPEPSPPKKKSGGCP